MEEFLDNEEEVPMTVDTAVPNGDVLDQTPVANVLIISEEGAMETAADKLSKMMNVAYFQRLPGLVPRLFDEESFYRLNSWRPRVGWADVIIVDDPSYVARLAKDFKLNGTIVLYHVSSDTCREAERLIHWMNPLTLATLRDAMENVDIEPVVVDIRQGRWWKRLFRINRA